MTAQATPSMAWSSIVPKTKPWALWVTWTRKASSKTWRWARTAPSPAASCMWAVSAAATKAPLATVVTAQRSPARTVTHMWAASAARTWEAASPTAITPATSPATSSWAASAEVAITTASSPTVTGWTPPPVRVFQATAAKSPRKPPSSLPPAR